MTKVISQEISDELNKLFAEMKKKMAEEYQFDGITPNCFILSVLEDNECVANKIMTKLMFENAIDEARVNFSKMVLDDMGHSPDELYTLSQNFNANLNEAISISTSSKCDFLYSGHILCTLFKNDKTISKYFKDKAGISGAELKTLLDEEILSIKKENKQKPVKHQKKPQQTQQQNDKDYILKQWKNAEKITGGSMSLNGEAEKYFKNINILASKGKIDNFVSDDKRYNKLFSILSKRNKNNAIIVGPSGVGKTHFVLNLAKKIISGDVPEAFKNKVLLQVDFASLFTGTAMRGIFEARLNSIMADAEKKNDYIFFLDNLAFNETNNISQSDIETFIERVLMSRHVMFIMTSSDKNFGRCIQPRPEWEKMVTKMEMGEPSEEECLDILKSQSTKLQTFHGVKYEEAALVQAIKLAKRFVAERNLPESAIDTLDAVAAKKTLIKTEDTRIVALKKDLKKLKAKKQKAEKESNYELLDETAKQEIEIQKKIDFIEKETNLNEKTVLITVSDIKELLSENTGIPLQDVTDDDKIKLKTLNEDIKKFVIGQDQAVDVVCRAVKGWRVGIKNPNKPLVYLFAGNSGCGKTYLAKIIAKQIFGSEKKLVRFDMGEYTDKTSVNKLIGTGSGYVGYENSGLLTNNLKKNKHCVLLLDEIEKADNDIYNVLLSAFDEGKLTDNKGFCVDLKNIIIIMTSNVGAKTVAESGKGIGFIKEDTSSYQASIIEKELKKHFKPEFINRIDNVVYFNKLTKENLKEIIVLELEKLRKRIVELGYDFDKTIFDNEIVDSIYDKIKEKENYGARPIMREIQIQIEEKLTDFIIDNNVEKGHIFTRKELKGNAYK